jgi:proton-dependent oligopeptide transporter, POT family
MKNQILGHPTGLFVLFFTEMWERFSYYGMRALLVLYMTQSLFLQIDQGHEVLGFSGLKIALEFFFGPLSSQAMSSQIYGLYTGLVYFTPFFGGIIADRWIGQRRSVYVGGILMAIGHFLMAFESLFFPALLFLIVGNGFFKPNLSAQVGGLYLDGDNRKDRAYTIYYMGVNLGAFLSPLVCGTLGQKYGWHYGFTAAGIGMILGLLIYHLGRKHLPEDLKHQSQEIQAHENHALSKEDKNKIYALMFLCIINILFWSVYEQQGNTLQIWADQNTDWNLFGFEIPSTWFQSFNPLMIFMLAPVMDIIWGWQSRRGREPNSITKMAIGCFLAGLAFVVMIANVHTVGTDAKGSIMWLVGTVFLFTIGELYLSPIGLSLVTKLAPKRMISMLMGAWFFSSFFGNFLAGYIGSFYEKMGQGTFFTLMTALACSAGVLFILANKPLRKVI